MSFAPGMSSLSIFLFIAKSAHIFKTTIKKMSTMCIILLLFFIVSFKKMLWIDSTPPPIIDKGKKHPSKVRLKASGYGSRWYFNRKSNHNNLRNFYCQIFNNTNNIQVTVACTSNLEIDRISVIFNYPV